MPIHSPFVDSVLNELPVSICMLKAVWQDAEIKDFEYLLVNEEGRKHFPGAASGKTFLAANDDMPLFQMMVKVMETGSRAFSAQLVTLGEMQYLFNVKFVKLKEGVLLIYERADKANEEASEKINELNRILESKNQDLETLNLELKAFNTVATHDYKETIQILYTNLEYIISKEARNLSDTAKANIRRAQAAIQKMKLLTEDINEYLRLYDIRISKSLTDPNAVLADVLSQMKERTEQAGARIERTELPLLYADPILFALLLTNIIDNAIKSRKLTTSPIITIKHSQADKMNAVPAALKNTAYTIISISDNGIGFKEEDTEKMFELFYRIRDGHQPKGSGIGLAVCKKIMIMHNGFITAESISANGAIFNCYFPSEK